MSAFRTMDAGICAANCGKPIEVGDLVVIVNDEVVHLECEDPESAIAAEQRERVAVDQVRDVDDPLLRLLALNIANAEDAEFGGAEVTEDEDLTPTDLAIARTVLLGSAVALIRAEALREAASAIAHAGEVSGRNTAYTWLLDRAAAQVAS